MSDPKYAPKVLDAARKILRRVFPSETRTIGEAWDIASVLASEVEPLVAALRTVTDKFERCIVRSGSDPEYAAIAVADERAVLARWLAPASDGQGGKL